MAGRRWFGGSARARVARRKVTLRVCVVVAGLLVALLGLGASRARADGVSVQIYTGTLPDTATYKIELPSGWNGTLLLYSHGYVVPIPGTPNPATDVGDSATGTWLLDHGYALAGSSYATTGWAIKQAIPDQIATLNTFKDTVGTPTRTIAWGHSLGGMITAGLLQEYPDRFAAAMPMCGVLGGGVGTWNAALDSAFAFKQFFDTSGALKLVGITDPSTNLGIAESLLAAAQATPQGQARIALVAALADLPGWFDPTSPQPAATDYTAQEANQYEWAANIDFPFEFAFRAELEYRAGGNPSWNTGVDYAKQLANSVDNSEVKALYAKAGLNLESDLATLKAATRISANPSAVGYLTDNVSFSGDLRGKPVLTLHTTGDGLVANEEEQAYQLAVNKAHDGDLLRQVFVQRAGHCAFTSAETIAGLQALVARLDTGKWQTNAAELNAAAAALGPLNVLAPPISASAGPSFVNFEPRRFLRPYPISPN